MEVKKHRSVRGMLLAIAMVGSLMAEQAIPEGKNAVKMTNNIASGDVKSEWSEFSFMIRASSIGDAGGVGVFATHNIPAGAFFLNKSFEARVLKTKDVPKEFVKYCIYLNDEELLCPERFDRMEIGWFINHSFTPNIAYNSDKRSLYAIRNIKAGEEILIDYNYLDEPEYLKDDFYKH